MPAFWLFFRFPRKDTETESFMWRSLYGEKLPEQNLSFPLKINKYINKNKTLRTYSSYDFSPQKQNLQL